MKFVLIIALRSFAIQGGVTTAEFNTYEACTNAIVEAQKVWNVEGICVPKGVDSHL